MFRKLPPAITALLIQLAAFVMINTIARQLALPLTPVLFALLCGMLATVLTHLIGMARWWIAIQFLFIPGIAAILALDVPPLFFLAAFLLLLFVYWSTFRSQVPLYLSSQKIWCALENLLPERQAFSFIDLGSGLGGVLTHLAHSHPHGHYHGVEAAPFPFLWSWLRIRLGKFPQCSVQWGSFWNCDLSQYDVVFAYLSPVPMSKLWLKARKEMRPGSIFISNTFEVSGQPPQQTFTVDDLHHSTLYIWHM